MCDLEAQRTCCPVPNHIEHWPLDKLILYAKNPRTHSDTQVAQIVASIAEFGFNNPILVDTKVGIIAGHGRLLAARKLQLTEVPVIVGNVPPASRVRAAPRKSLLPAWLVEELQSQGVRFDAAACPEPRPMN